STRDWSSDVCSSDLLLLTLAGLLNERRSAGPAYDRQGRRILGLFAAFCVASIASATLGETGPESLIELVTYFWLCVALVVICQQIGRASCREGVEIC